MERIVLNPPPGYFSAMETDYSIWAFAYARSSMPRDFFGGTLINSNKGRVRNPMVYSAILGGEVGGAARPIIIDTGMKGDFSPSGKGYKNVESTETVLAKIGLVPDEIETVILTHLHFDHAGNLDQFPNAEFLVQRAEYDGWKRAFELPGDLGSNTKMWPMSSINKNDFVVLDALIAEGRVRFLHGDAEIAPGVHCHFAPDTHTFGSQWVEVRTADGPYVVAGDCVYWYQNIEAMWPPGYVQGNCWRLIDIYQDITRLLDGRTDRIVPGHDPELFERHDSWVAGFNHVAELHLAAGQVSRRPAPPAS
ncbi:MAG: N-acyl homoserine lactonase family protein [Rhodospirillales bacterium]|nr:N-acyl homoserine lactonase family protein [Rhodospirillales bacterium]